MTVRYVKLWPDDALKTPALPVQDVKSPVIQKFIKDLRDTTKAYRAQGIAAPQIDVHQRIIVVKGADEVHRVLVNPEYLSKSENTLIGFEGCLSFPGVRARIVRAEEVTITYLDEDGNPHKWTPTGMDAIAVQHEMDHLNGIVMLDHMTKMEKNIAIRRLKKVKKRLGAYA